jgi:hypothetical protein
VHCVQAFVVGGRRRGDYLVLFAGLNLSRCQLLEGLVIVPPGELTPAGHVVTSAASQRGETSLLAQDLRDSPLMGEIDPGGTRKGGLDAFLDQKIAEGYLVETRTDTHAIISRRPKGLKRLTSGSDPGRYVVEVDEDGTATMRPAEPRRT